jgi:hypothetical protein
VEYTYYINKKNAEGPKGKPDIMFFNPEVYGTRSYGTPVDEEDIEACRELYDLQRQPSLPCMPEFVELVDELVGDVMLPTTVEEAFNLFSQLTNMLE